MFAPISLLWVHIILVLFAYILGKRFSSVIEPVPIDNILKEVHNKRLPIFLISVSLMVYVLGGMFLELTYIPSLKVIEFLSKEIEGTIVIRVFYLLTHSLPAFALPVLAKFLANVEYKYKVLLFASLVVISVGLIHFSVFLLVFAFTAFAG